MKNNTPKVARAMEHLDEDMVLNAAREPRRRRTPWAAVAACLVVVILAAAVMPGFLGGSAVETVVALDVNPSMEINVDRNEKVIDVLPLNDDAVKVIGDMDLKKVDLEVAVNALVGAMLKNGYLTMDRNSILVSVDSRDAAKGEALQRKLSEDVAQMLEGSNLQASVLTQSYTKPAAAATAAAISPAKDALVRKIEALNMTDTNGVPYTYEHLSALSVHELKQLVESRAIMQVENVTSTGMASTSNYIGNAAAFSIACQHGGFNEIDVVFAEWELDHEMGCMVYSIDFCCGGTEYEYDINAVTGAVVTHHSERCDDGGHGHSAYDDDWDDHHDDHHDDWDDMPPTNALSRDELVSMALSYAGVASGNIRDLDMDYDYEYGRNVCEVSFDSGNTEYEVTLDAITGEVLFYESERD